MGKPYLWRSRLRTAWFRVADLAEEIELREGRSERWRVVQEAALHLDEAWNSFPKRPTSPAMREGAKRAVQNRQRTPGGQFTRAQKEPHEAAPD